MNLSISLPGLIGSPLGTPLQPEFTQGMFLRLEVMIKLKRLQCSVSQADYCPVSNLPWLAVDG